ncbi:MAG: ABC transporter ATP-binding protein [Oscillospiraceae bacterium]|nr:ABC transporter ATP-binding protein [Oscillospiraceae bacterium]
MLEIRELSAGYGGKLVLHDVSIEIPMGQVTVILGPNGCGKSTLLKTICGILKAEKGRIMLNGENLLTLPQKQIAQRVAYLSQSRQIPDITVRRLVLHGRFPYLSYPRRYRPEDYAAADAAIENMGMVSFADTPLNKLSGGQRQKVYIAMALAQDTPVILLDEPTTYLDISHQLQLMRQAKELTAQGKTVVMIVHDLSHAMTTADHIVLMQCGGVVVQGTAEELYTSGKIDNVFRIKMGRARTDRGFHYYCEEA